MGKYCAAVELLLARMDSNPEEFTDGGRWERLLIRHRSYLPMEDQMALTDKLNTLRMDVFHKDVMKELLAEPNDDVAMAAYTATTTIPAGVIATTIPAGAIGASQLNGMLNAINLSQNSIQELAQQLQQYASNAWRK
jgi:hypothetical protein